MKFITFDQISFSHPTTVYLIAIINCFKTYSKTYLKLTLLTTKIRSSRQGLFQKTPVLENLIIITGKHP